VPIKSSKYVFNRAQDLKCHCETNSAQAQTEVTAVLHMPAMLTSEVYVPLCWGSELNNIIKMYLVCNGPRL